MPESSARGIVLASASAIRKRLLADAGVAVTVHPARIGEAAIARAVAADPAGLARVLAKAKAIEVSTRFPRHWVIGADQTLDLDGSILSKVPDVAAGLAVLCRLRGRAHKLHSGVAVASGGLVVFEHVGTATLTMRDYSDAFVEDYARQAGAALTASVGAYQLEGLGLQLMERIEGDYFTILGLPMLPLLATLRSLGALKS